jgi:hypothetical protein
VFRIIDAVGTTGERVPALPARPVRRPHPRAPRPARGADDRAMLEALQPVRSAAPTLISSAASS